MTAFASGCSCERLGDPVHRHAGRQPGLRVDVRPDPDRHQPGQHQAEEQRLVDGAGDDDLVAGLAHRQADRLVAVRWSPAPRSRTSPRPTALRPVARRWPAGGWTPAGSPPRGSAARRGRGTRRSARGCAYGRGAERCAGIGQETLIGVVQRFLAHGGDCCKSAIRWRRRTLWVIRKTSWRGRAGGAAPAPALEAADRAGARAADLTAAASFGAAVVSGTDWDPRARQMVCGRDRARSGLLLVLWLTVRPFFAWLTTHFVITDRRVMYRHGVLTRAGIDIPLARINSVEFRHGLLDRMVRTGTLVIESASQDPLEFNDIPQVEQVHSLLYHEVFDTLGCRATRGCKTPEAARAAHASRRRAGSSRAPISSSIASAMPPGVRADSSARSGSRPARRGTPSGGTPRTGTPSASGCR